jgi:hypothetical protein
VEQQAKQADLAKVETALKERAALVGGTLSNLQVYTILYPHLVLLDSIVKKQSLHLRCSHDNFACQVAKRGGF